MEPARDSKPGQALGRVVDPVALDEAGTRKARASLSLPEGWLREGSSVRFVVPRRLGCDACGGGGCGGCDNRGGFVVPEELDRTVSLSLAGGSERVRVRVVPPFAPSAGFDVLMVDIRGGEASLGARRIELASPSPTVVSPTADLRLLLFALLSLALLLAVGLAVLR